MANSEMLLSQNGLQHRNVNIFKGNEPLPFVARKYERGVHIPECVHQHPEAEVCFMPWDAGVMLMDGAAHSFCAGDMFLISGNTYHHPIFDSPNNRGLIVVYFSSQFADQIPPAWFDLKASLISPGGVIKLEGNREAAHLMLELSESLQSSQSKGDVICQGIFLHLMAHFAEKLKSENRQLSNGVHISRFSKTLAFIHAKLSADIKVSDLHQFAGMSRSRFCEEFKACFGFSASQYIQRARLERSKHLLRSSASSVSQIAYACGFNSPSFFNRVFKSSTGASPSQYRKQPGITGSVISK